MSRIDRSLDSVDKGLNRIKIGCMALLVNLLFAAFCFWGVYAASVGWRLQTQGATTTGTVVRMEESDSGDGGCCVYSPVVEFQAGGELYSFDGGNASDPPDYSVGQQVEVRYDSANPNTAQIDSFYERWLFPLIIIPAMIIAALVTNFLMLRAFLRGDDAGE